MTPDIFLYMSVSLYEDAAGGRSMLPSLFTSEEDRRPWSVPRAALYGAGLGLLAALIKLFGPFHPTERTLPFALEIGVAVLVFANPLRRCCSAAQSAGATAPGHGTLKGAITDKTVRRHPPAVRAG